MEPVTANIAIKAKGRSIHAKATKMRFSAHQCFAFDSGAHDKKCLRLLAHYLLSKNVKMAFYGSGRFFHYLLDHAPELKKIAAFVLEDTGSPEFRKVRGIPVISPAELPSSIKTVFLCETLTVPRLSMKKKLASGKEILSPDILAELDWQVLPARAWIPEFESIYPMDLPEIEFLPHQDMILIDCPARNLALMPNGLAYVHNALKKTSLKFQTVDLDIIIYHRFHMHRLMDTPGTIRTQSGYEILPDPWLAEAYDEWQKPEVIEYFRPEIHEISRKLIAARPKIAGFSIQACNLKFVREIVKQLKEALPETVILVGGFSCYQTSIGLHAFPECDYMCMGEADLTVGPLAEALARGERPRDLPGVFSRYDSPGYSFTDYPMPQDLDVLEMPQYDWTDLRLYRNYNDYQLTPIIASRGCRWSRCTFCAERFFWRVRSPNNVVDEFEWLYKQGCDLFMFNESDLNGKPEILVAICNEIVRRGLKIKLTGQLRIHKNSNRAFFDKLHAGGFVALRFGVDAWTTNTLRQQMKGYTTAMIYQNLKDCWESGIFTEVNTVIGVPGETDADIEESVELMAKCKPFIGRAANINPLMLVIGSVYWEDPEKFKIRFRGDKEEIFQKYPSLIPPHLWYSEEPYIDQPIRLKRFERIVRALDENGFDVGAFAKRVIQDVQEGKGADHSARPDVANEIQTVTCEDATANSAVVIRAESNLLTEPPRPADKFMQIIRYEDEFYGVSADVDPSLFDAKLSVHKRGKISSFLQIFIEKGQRLLGDDAKRKDYLRRALRVWRTEGLAGIRERIERKIKTWQMESLVVETHNQILQPDYSASTWLVREGFHGYNVVRIKKDFYGIRQGYPFEKNMADDGAYPEGICYKAVSLEEIEKILEEQALIR